MSTDSDDAYIKGQIAALAKLYDAFVHAIDPHSKERDEAERIFRQDVAEWHDRMEDPKPNLHEFTKGIIIRCRSHLKATRKLGDVSEFFNINEKPKSK